MKKLISLVVIALIAAMPSHAGFFMIPITTSGCTATFPFGTLGDLVITSGQTVNLQTGNIYDYNSITIDSGGTLSINGSGWVRIGVKDKLVNNGTIIARNNGEVPSGQTYSTQELDLSGSPTGSTLTFTNPTRLGGNGGGYQGYSYGEGNPGLAAFGNGGGGAGTACEGVFHDGQSASSTKGGDGGVYDDAFPGVGGGFAGATVYGNAGGSGAVNGGGGGSRGYSGAGIWLKAGSVSGNGVITASGQPGGAGGSSTAIPSYCWSSSGQSWGGGGGAGGNAGFIKLLVAIGKNSFKGTVTSNGGGGGAAGLGLSEGTLPQAGQDGQSNTPVVSSFTPTCPWPQSESGPSLVVDSGQTVTLASGISVYNSITVNEGGTLQCPAGNDWTIVGVRGSVVNKGTISCRMGDSPSSQTLSTSIAPDGEPLSYTRWPFMPGGSGGLRTILGSTGSGGPQYYGNGGGGASGFVNSSTGYNHPTLNDPNSANENVGGRGGYSSKTPWGVPIVPAINGGWIYGGSGSIGALSQGGGGGARGYSGGALYMNILGSLTGNGVFDISGRPGGSGGQGNGGDYTYSCLGSGGGGGAGGNAGALALKVGTNSFSGKILAGGGLGGTGGNPGTPDVNNNPCGSTFWNQRHGDSGQTGNGGTIKIFSSWPTGGMGDLTIGNNQTVYLNPGTIYDYNSITIDTGGSLICNPGAAWIVIGVKTHFVNKGTFSCRKFDNNGVTGNFKMVAPDGTSLSHTFYQSAGGPGATKSEFGNGGGGLGTGPNSWGGWPGIQRQAGDGGYGGWSEGYAGGCDDYGCGWGLNGVGGSTFGAAGTNGTMGSSPTPEYCYCNYQGGGGGGFRGYSGAPVYMNIGGNFSGSGQIDLSGQAGGAPGNGAGGGAGGSGGKFVVKIHGTNSFPSGNVNVSAGSGGGGGAANGTAGSTSYSTY